MTRKVIAAGLRLMAMMLRPVAVLMTWFCIVLLDRANRIDSSADPLDQVRGI